MQLAKQMRFRRNWRRSDAVDSSPRPSMVFIQREQKSVLAFIDPTRSIAAKVSAICAGRLCKYRATSGRTGHAGLPRTIAVTSKAGPQVR